jgi:hypothetical protein
MFKAVAGFGEYKLVKRIELSGSKKIVGACRGYAGFDYLHYLTGDLIRRENIVGLTRGNGSERHAGKFSCLGLLDKGGAAHCFDHLYTACPIRTRSGEDNAYRVVFRVFREGNKKFIDRQMDMLSREALEGEDPVFEARLFRGRTEIKFSGFNFESVGYFFYLEVWVMRAQQVRQQASMSGREVLHEDKREIEFTGQGRQKTFKGMKAACRGAYADDQKAAAIFYGLSLRFWFHFYFVNIISTKTSAYVCEQD